LVGDGKAKKALAGALKALAGQKWLAASSRDSSLGRNPCCATSLAQVKAKSLYH
jgi:hypothetical protein